MSTKELTGLSVGGGRERSPHTGRGNAGEEEERARRRELIIRRWMRDPVGLVVSDLMIASAELVGVGLF